MFSKTVVGRGGVITAFDLKKVTNLSSDQALLHEFRIRQWHKQALTPWASNHDGWQAAPNRNYKLKNVTFIDCTLLNNLKCCGDG